jgi:hypothetical protein
MAHAAQLACLIGVALMFVTGCEGVARRDVARPTVQSPFAAPRAARAQTSATAPAVRQNVAAAADPKITSFRESTIPDKEEIVSQPLNLVGQSEGDIRARFGAPVSEEDRSPGKTWRYRYGSCALDVSLYPDIQTRKFTTLAYEVRSDDNTDQAKRLCIGQLQSRGRIR